MMIPKCPVETTLIFLEDRVKILIVGYLLKESLRPTQLKEKIGVRCRYTLYYKLKELEDLGVIEHNVDEEVPTKVEYLLTDLGKTFYNIIVSMEAWGEQYKESISFDK